jgi:hypothetical protein
MGRMEGGESRPGWRGEWEGGEGVYTRPLLLQRDDCLQVGDPEQEARFEFDQRGFRQDVIVSAASAG